MIHPDLATSGGILETQKIGDMARKLRCRVWQCISRERLCRAWRTCIARRRRENFLVLENHSVDVPWWNDLVTAWRSPSSINGFITVPDKPGLGVDAQ